jgi:hypothetical protein
VKGNDRIQPEKITKKAVSDINRDVIVFAFFLFLSFGLWYVNSLGKEVEADIKYLVKYINLPKGRTIYEETPSKLSFSLKGPGYSVLKLKVTGKKPPVLIDLSKVAYKRVPESKNSDYFIVTSGLVKSLTVQIRTGCEILMIKPDTLFFIMNKETLKPLAGKR